MAPMMVAMVFSWDTYGLIGNCHHPELLMTLEVFIDEEAII
jgi:hypothetical protein